MEQDCTLGETTPHIANIGRMVEDMENKIRSTLNEIYFSKTRDIVNGLRSINPLSEQKARGELKKDLAAALKLRNASRTDTPNS
jgi:capping protein beta